MDAASPSCLCATVFTITVPKYRHLLDALKWIAFYTIRASGIETVGSVQFILSESAVYIFTFTYYRVGMDVHH